MCLTLRLRFSSFLLITVILASCASYRQNVLFQTEAQEIHQHLEEAEASYRIRPDDKLSLEVYTNKGEKLIDPNRQSFQSGTSAGVAASSSDEVYAVDVKGNVKFPLIGEIALAGLTLKEAEALLEKEYEKFYEQAYVLLKFLNKRVIVLGAPGGQVIPMTNEHMRLTEILALAKGIPMDGRANNIRVIRDDQMLVADFSTFQGYQQGNVFIRPGDIIYIEPVHRPFIEALRDYSPIITIVTSLATLIFIISQVK
jgi:polysaccharide export outer membrane protein